MKRKPDPKGKTKVLSIVLDLEDWRILRQEAVNRATTITALVKPVLNSLIKRFHRAQVRRERRRT